MILKVLDAWTSEASHVDSISLFLLFVHSNTYVVFSIDHPSYLYCLSMI